VAFGMYAVLGGVIGMPASFPPASVLNSSTLLGAIGVPIEVLRSIAGLVIAVGVVRTLDLFEQETDRTLAQARRHELLLRERERIGRDLHDGIIQSIYAAGLHLEEATATLVDAEPTNKTVVRTDANPVAAPGSVAKARLQTVMGELNRITGDIRAYIFDLRSASLDTLDAEEIVTGVADELRANTAVKLDLRVEGDYRPRLSPEQAEQLRHIAQEAFSNVLRHAHARHVEVVLHCTRRRFTFRIRDDGVGYDTTAAVGGLGLRNIRERAFNVGASLEVSSTPGAGTAAPDADPDSSYGHRMSIRVLICDDHEVVREGLHGLIGRQPGMSLVGEAGTVAEAIEAAARTKPDVVVMDVRLPDGSGVEACRSIPRDPGARRLEETGSPAGPAS